MEQINSLVGHIRRHDNLLESDTFRSCATTGFALAGVCAATKLDKVNLAVVERGRDRSKADSAARKINSNTSSENDSPSTTTAGGDKQYFWGDRCGTGTDLALKSIVPIRHRINGYSLAMESVRGISMQEETFWEMSCAQLLKRGIIWSTRIQVFRRWSTGTMVGDHQYKGSDDDRKDKESGADT